MEFEIVRQKVAAQSRKLRAGWVIEDMDTTIPRVSRAYKGETLITVPWKILAGVQQWMETSFGPGGRNRKYSWRQSQTQRDHFFVRDQQIVTLFMLKWVGNNA